MQRIVMDRALQDRGFTSDGASLVWQHPSGIMVTLDALSRAEMSGRLPRLLSEIDTMLLESLRRSA